MYIPLLAVYEKIESRAFVCRRSKINACSDNIFKQNMRVCLQVSVGSQTAKNQGAALNHDGFCAVRVKKDAAKGSVGKIRPAPSRKIRV